MRLQVVFAAYCIYLGLAPAPVALASTPGQNPCFDFNSKIVSALHEPIPEVAGRVASKSGKLSSGVVWGAARSEVKRPLLDILKGFYDHNLTKSSRVDEMNVVELTNPNHLARHEVKFKIKPFPFILVQWTEQWAYTLAQGSAADPAVVVISYEKTEGTSYIQHLCGNVVLRKSGDKVTDVYLYEETKATQRDEKDTVASLVATLSKLKTISDPGPNDPNPSDPNPAVDAGDETNRPHPERGPRS